MASLSFILVSILLLGAANGLHDFDGLRDLPDAEGDAELLSEIERYLSERETELAASANGENEGLRHAPQATVQQRRTLLSGQVSEITDFLVDSQADMQQSFMRIIGEDAERFQEIEKLAAAAGDGYARSARSASPHGRYSPFSRVQKLLAPRGQSQGFSLVARYVAFLLNQLKERFDLSREDIIKLYTALALFPQQLPPVQPMQPDVVVVVFTVETCPYPDASQADVCDARSMYRTIDGSCNNLQNPLWGRSNRPLSRFIQPDYADGISEPRVGVNGNELPGARSISSKLFEGRNILAPAHTLSTMVFGQFADHDIGLTPVSTLSMDESGVGDMVDVKCGASECETDGPENEECFPIMVDPSDPFFGGQECLMFVRSQPAPAENCAMSPRQQFNVNTAYLDASMIYGSTLEQSNELRDLTDTNRGRLRVTPNAKSSLKPLLPQDDNSPDCQEFATPTVKCFAAGDGRVNEQVGLTAMHTIFMRYHNYIEERLHRHNPYWSGEKLFQESRRIMIAVWQYILYEEFVPMVLGPDRVRQYQLKVDQPGNYPGYDESILAEIGNVMQTAAFRFGHTLIPDMLHQSSNKFGNEESVHLSEAFELPAEIYNNDGPADSGVDNLMFAQASQQAFKNDHTFTKQITRHLFTHEPPFGIGTDLTALNIQRGRDHGLPGYLRWREWCELSVPKNFYELSDIADSARDTLQSLYTNVEDIDIFAAGVAETPVAGGLVGPTFACIIGHQFRNLRVADRFWFEREGVDTSFTTDQIAEVRRISLAKIMCHTLDNVDTIQPRVLLQPFSTLVKNIGYRRDELYDYIGLYHSNRFNERQDCDELPDIDFSKWQD